jgi:hypothetical protein
LKGSWLTYMVKILMNFVVLAGQEMKVKQSSIVFNKAYNRLWNFSTSTKPNASKDNIKFEATQMEDIFTTELVSRRFDLHSLEIKQGGGSCCKTITRNSSCMNHQSFWNAFLAHACWCRWGNGKCQGNWRDE